MKIDPKIKRAIKEMVLVIMAAWLKAWYMNQIDRLIDFAVEKIDKDYENERGE